MRKKITQFSNSCKQLVPLIKMPAHIFIPILLLVFCVNQTLHAQTGPIKISGTVSDSKGEKLIGVTVKVKGTAVAAATDVNGAYSINVVDKKSTLVFSYIGFDPKEEVVGDRKVVSVKLGEAASNLSEVVVTGYGQSVRKSDLVGSIGSVSAKQIQERQH